MADAGAAGRRDDAAEPDKRPEAQPGRMNGGAPASLCPAGITDRQLDAIVRVALAKGLLVGWALRGRKPGGARTAPPGGGVTRL